MRIIAKARTPIQALPSISGIVNDAVDTNEPPHQFCTRVRAMGFSEFEANRAKSLLIAWRKVKG